MTQDRHEEVIHKATLSLQVIQFMVLMGGRCLQTSSSGRQAAVLGSGGHDHMISSSGARLVPRAKQSGPTAWSRSSLPIRSNCEPSRDCSAGLLDGFDAR